MLSYQNQVAQLRALATLLETKPLSSYTVHRVGEELIAVGAMLTDNAGDQNEDMRVDHEERDYERRLRAGARDAKDFDKYEHDEKIGRGMERVGLVYDTEHFKTIELMRNGGS